MDEFGRVIYLDVEKTGSSTVSSFLASVLSDLPRRFVKHARPDAPIGPDRIVLTTVRDPVAQWLSLYQFGVEVGGPVRQHLERDPDRPFRYDGTLADFLLWLTYALDPAHAPRFPGGYANGAPSLIGLQTHRFLRLNLGCPPRRLARVADREGLRQLVARQRVAAHVMRTERLRDELAHACRNVLAPVLADPEAAAAQALAHPSVKVSSARQFVRADLPADAVRRILDREWLLIETFYPALATAAPCENANGPPERAVPKLS